MVSLLLGHNPWRVNHVVPEGTEQLSFCNFTSDDYKIIQYQNTQVPV